MTGYDSKYTGMIADLNGNGGSIPLDPPMPHDAERVVMTRDYCGHEHLPKFNLINMNARLYDPWASRFLSPDPYVQLPDFTQSLNRYSYCLNNPLKYVDQNGEVWLISKTGNRTYYMFDDDVFDEQSLHNKYGNNINLHILKGKNFLVTLREEESDIILGEVFLNSHGMILYNGEFVPELIYRNICFAYLQFYDFGKKNNMDVQKMHHYNIFGFYVGPNNPRIDGHDSYALPPLNDLDYAAFQHDLGYDKLNARGLMGVLSYHTINEDILLMTRSIKAMLSYPIGSNEMLYSLATAYLFFQTSIRKYYYSSIPIVGEIYKNISF